jgi:hypothetical protein
MESDLAAGLSIAFEDLAAAFNRDLCFREGRTITGQCPGPTLAGLAVTHVYQNRIAGCYRT